MLTIKEFMELIDYRITEGSKYGWNCYGPNAYMLDSWDGEQEGHSFVMIFDTVSQEVYEVQAHDYLHNRAYRMINEDFLKKMRKEARHRNVSKTEAWEDVDYVDLDVDDDFIQKSLAIRAGEDYDTSVMIELDLPDDLILQTALAAHREGITLNDYINRALAHMADEIKQNGIDKFMKDHNGSEKSIQSIM